MENGCFVSLQENQITSRKRRGFLRPDLEHSRSRNRIVLQRVQRSIGFAQWKHLYARADGNLRSNAQKILSVLARIVGHTANDTFLIEQIVVKRRNRAHVDAAQNQGSALPKRLTCGGNNLTARRKNYGGIEFFGR